MGNEHDDDEEFPAPLSGFGTPQDDDELELEEPSSLAMMFMLMHDHFKVMRSVGFSESQALRYLAFCTIYGDEDEDVS